MLTATGRRENRQETGREAGRGEGGVLTAVSSEPGALPAGAGGRHECDLDTAGMWFVLFFGAQKAKFIGGAVRCGAVGCDAMRWSWISPILPQQ